MEDTEDLALNDYNDEENSYTDGPAAGLLPFSSKQGPFKLFVTKVYKDLSTTALVEIFSKPEIGIPISVFKKEVHDAHRQFTFALVEYNTIQEAQNAIREVHNREPLRLKVSIAETDAERAKRRRRQVEEAVTESLSKQSDDANSKPVWHSGNLYSTTLYKQIINVESEESDDESQNKLPVGCQKSILENCSEGIISAFFDNDNSMFTTDTYHFIRSSHLCAYCPKFAVACCNRCGLGYCSRSCQASDWPNHKSDCRLVPLSDDTFIPCKSKETTIKSFKNTADFIKLSISDQFISVDVNTSGRNTFDTVPCDIPVIPFPPGCHEIRLLGHENPSTMSVSIVNCNNILQDVKSKLDNLVSLPLAGAKSGVFCVAKSSESYVRAKVVSLSQNGAVMVALLDFGVKVNVDFNDCYMMPEKLLKIPVVGIPAKIAGIKPIGDSWTSESLEIFNQLINAEKIRLYAESLGKDENGILLLKLYLSDGSGKTDVASLMLKGGAAESCSYSLANDTQTISGMKLAQTTCDNSKNLDVRADLAEFHSNKSVAINEMIKLSLLNKTEACYWLMIINGHSMPLIEAIDSKEFQDSCHLSSPLAYSPVERDVVAAFSPSHNVWLRACILNKQTLEVFYFDHGEMEKVSTIRNLNKKYHKPALVWYCNLGELDIKTLGILEDLQNGMVTATVTAIDSNSIQLEISGHALKLTDWSEALSLGMLSFCKKATGTNRLTLRDLKTRNRLPSTSRIVLVYFIRPRFCVVHLEDELNDLLSLNEQLLIHCKSAPLSTYRPEVKELVAYQSSDQKWYRGVVLAVEDKEAVVHCVDFGNTDTVSLHCVQKLHPTFTDQVFGIEVFLEGIDERDPSDYFCSHIIDYCNKHYDMKVMKEGIVPLVQLNDDSVNLNDIIQRLSHPRSEFLHSSVPMFTLKDCQCNPWQMGESLDLRINGMFNEMLSGVCVKHEEIIKQFTTTVQDHCIRAREKIFFSAKVNQLCFAWNSETKQWGRAFCLQTNDERLFFFIDSGHCCHVPNSNIIPLDKQFLDFPVYSILARPQERFDPTNEEDAKELKQHLLNKVHRVLISKIDSDYAPLIKFTTSC